jgi:hypothetical protein
VYNCTSNAHQFTCFNSFYEQAYKERFIVEYWQDIDSFKKFELLLECMSDVVDEQLNTSSQPKTCHKCSKVYVSDKRECPMELCGLL